MVRFIVLLFPSFISLGLFNSLYKRNISILKTISLYCSFATLNLLLMSFILYIRKQSLIIIDENMNNIGFLFKYLILTTLFSIILPVIFYTYIKFQIKISIKKEN